MKRLRVRVSNLLWRNCTSLCTTSRWVVSLWITSWDVMELIWVPGMDWKLLYDHAQHLLQFWPKVLEVMVRGVLDDGDVFGSSLYDAYMRFMWLVCKDIARRRSFELKAQNAKRGRNWEKVKKACIGEALMCLWMSLGPLFIGRVRRQMAWVEFLKKIWSTWPKITIHQLMLEVKLFNHG